VAADVQDGGFDAGLGRALAGQETAGVFLGEPSQPSLASSCATAVALTASPPWVQSTNCTMTLPFVRRTTRRVSCDLSRARRAR
jgi:hypothetical protein